MHVKRVTIDSARYPVRDRYPFNLRIFQLTENLEFDSPVTFFLGENGTGKSTVIKSLTALLPSELYKVSGNVLFEGTDLLNASEEKLIEIRRNNIRYVFQDATNSFDPLKKISYYFDLSNISPLKIEELLIYFSLPSYKKLSALHSLRGRRGALHTNPRGGGHGVAGYH